MKLITRISIICLIAITGSFLSNAQCINSSSWGSASAPTSGSTTISTCQWQTEYSTISNVAATTNYISTMSLGGCITVTAGSPNGTVIATGNSPLSWTSTVAGTYYIHYTTSCSPFCGTATSCGTSSIAYAGGGGGGGGGPTNDDPCNATPLTVGTSCSFSTFSNAGATASAGVPAPGCANYSGGDVWFTATIPASGQLTIDFDTGVITDGGAAAYAGPCTSLTLIGCDDDSSPNGLMPMLNITGTAGTTVWIRVWEYGNNNNGTFDICAYDTNPGGGGGGPANDDPCGATSIPVGATCTFSTFNNTGATNSSLTAGVTLPTCGSYNGGDVWFSITVPPSGNVIFDTDVGNITDSGMEIYRGPNCNSLTPLACDDDGSANGLMSMIQATTLIPGETIWIRIWEYGGNTFGTFDICAHDGGPNGGGPCTGGAGGTTCAQMGPICTQNIYCYTAGTGAAAGAGNNYGCLGSQPNPSWYYYEIDQAGNLIFDLSATNDIDFAVWGPYNNVSSAIANCGSLPAPIDCSYSISATEQVNIAGVNPGEIYILLVTNYANTIQDITIGAAGGNTASTNCAIVLPVELQNLTARTAGNDVLVSWETISEQGNDFFAIESSMDGRVWSAVGVKKGIGNSVNTNAYSFVEKDGAFAGTKYYRLKQFDIDGQVTVSEIVSIVESVDFGNVNISPNPASESIVVSSKDLFTSISIFDVNGVNALNESFEWTNGRRINLSDLSAGVYIVQIETINGVEIKRLIID